MNGKFGNKWWWTSGAALFLKPNLVWSQSPLASTKYLLATPLLIMFMKSKIKIQINWGHRLHDLIIVATQWILTGKHHSLFMLINNTIPNHSIWVTFIWEAKFYFKLNSILFIERNWWICVIVHFELMCVINVNNWR